MLSRFESINIPVGNPQKLVEFYRDILGVPCLFEGFGSYDGAQLGFDRSHPKIIIWDINKWNGEEVKVELAFCSDDLKGTMNELKTKNVQFSVSDDEKEVTLRDPYGNKILILQS
jgi:catechol 2,3-dioxygenase-like lactoylglutathione lyase family enzyme